MTSRIETFKAAVIAAIKTKLPELKETEVLGGRFNLDALLERSIRPPAVYFSMLKSPIAIGASGKVSLDAKCAAYIITEGDEAKRDSSAWTIAETIAVMFGEQPRWNTVKVGLPEKCEIEPLISAKYRKRGVTLIAVTWNQSITRLGDSLFDDEGTVFTTLYVNDDPVIEPEDA